LALIYNYEKKGEQSQNVTIPIDKFRQIDL